MAGDPLDPAWRGHCCLNDDPRGTAYRISPPSGIPWSGGGCNQCTETSCPYADFIRHYWHYPRCD